MPYYGPAFERIDGGDAKMFEEYKFGIPVTAEFISSTSSETLPVTISAKIFDIPVNDFEQVIKFGEKGYIKIGGDEYNYNWGDDGSPATRIIYIDEDIGEKDDIGLDKWVELTLESLGADANGKPHWASQPTDYYPFTDPLGPIVQEETFTLTFREFTPNVLGTSPYIDEDLRVIFIKSDGTQIECNKNNLSEISVTCTYPETVKIKVRGKYTKWLFPYDKQEYYFDKDKEYTPVPEHEPFDIEAEQKRLFDESQEEVPLAILEPDPDPDINYGDVPSIQKAGIEDADYQAQVIISETYKQLPFNPNDFVDAYRITQDFKYGTGPFGVIKDLSVEIPLEVNILKYEQDPNTDVDCRYRFQVGSVITGGPTTVTYEVGIALTAGSIVSVGDASYLVNVGGFVLVNDPPSGTAYYTDANGIEFQYRPDMLGTSFGAGTFYIKQNVMNNYLLGLQRYEEVLDERGLRRDK